MLALGKGRLFLVTEIFFNVLHVIVILVGLKLFGIKGVAIAHFVVNFIYIPCVYLIVKKLIFFRWSNFCKRLFVLSFTIFLRIYFIIHFLPQHFAITLAILIWLPVCRESLRG
jgi:antigen flippase